MKRESHYIGYDIASLGIVVKLSFKRKITPRSSEQLIESLLRVMARKYLDKAGNGVLRAKAFLTCSKGYIKADITGADKRAFIESKMKQDMSEAELAINIIAQGINNEEAKAITIEALEKTLEPKNGRFLIIKEQKTHH